MTSRFEGKIYPEKKQRYFKKVNELLDTFQKIMIVTCDNVQSQQLHKIRIALRGKAEIVMGKNTSIKKVLVMRRDANPSEANNLLHLKLVTEGLIKLNVGLVLFNGSPSDILDVIAKNKVQSPARQGATAPIEVVINAGVTTLEPTKTSFFQTLNIPTKINKGTIEILKDVIVIRPGDKVGSSEAALLAMLKINPFYYGLEVQKVYDNGSVYGKEVLTMTEDDKFAKFAAGVQRVAALSLALGYPTKASFPHLLMDTFKNVLSVSLGTEYTFKALGADELRTAIKEGKAIGGAAAPAPAAAAKGAPAAAPAAAAKKEEPEEEEDAAPAMDLFD